jgi:hypothetical protein
MLTPSGIEINGTGVQLQYVEHGSFFNSASVLYSSALFSGIVMTRVITRRRRETIFQEASKRVLTRKTEILTFWHRGNC